MTSKLASLFGELLDWGRRTAAAGLLSAYLNVTPAPASRPKVGRWGVYYGKNYQRFKSAAELEAANLDLPQTDKPVVLFMEHVVPKPRTSKRSYPRGDVDNYAKGPMDVLTSAGQIWKDDDQVVLLVASKRFAEDDEEAGVHIHWFTVTEDNP